MKGGTDSQDDEIIKRSGQRMKNKTKRDSECGREEPRDEYNGKRTHSHSQA